MKKVTSLIVIFLMGLTALFAQAPEKFTYQAVVRNASNALVTNAPVSVRLSILQGDVTGNAVYVEIHTVPTNANGLLTIEIGGGTVQQGSFADINWANGPFFLKTETDPAGGYNYSVTSTQQLMSVPYALYAKEAANGFSGDYNDLTNQPTIPTVPTNVSAFNNDAGYITMESIPSVPTNVSAFINDAGYVTGADIPNVPTNVSAFTNDAGYVTNTDIPNVPTNVSAFTNDAGYLTSFTEQQVLSISHDTLFLTGGSYVKLPNGFSGDYNDLVNQPDLFSGDYNDLTNKPTLFSGSYNDLTNKPTNADFGQALVRGTVNNPTGATDIAVTFSNYSLVSGGVVSIIFARNVPAGASLNINSQGSKPILWRGAALTDGIIKANDRCLFMYNSGANSYYLLAIDRWGVDINALAAVARTGSYNDLSDKPTIPTVPTDVSAFNNDAGYITMDSVPAVPTSVSAFTNDAGYLTSFTEQQVLSISHDTLFLTGGSFVKLPAGFDGDYNSLTNKPDLFSGDYNDLTNKPTLFSGSYNDLTNKPTNADFGQALVRGTVNNPTGATDIAVTFSNYSLVSGGVVSIIFARNVPAGASLNINDQGAKPISWRGAALTDGVIKANDRCLFMYNAAANRFYLLAIDRWGVDIDALAAVARTGSYNDLSDKPTIPTVPTDVSAFNNDAGYITMDSVPAVPTNVSAFTNDAGYITESDISDIQAIPTNVSQLNNDAGYITINSIPTGLAGSNTGDIMYWDAATGTWIMMPSGSSGQVLTVENGVPVWANLPEYTTMTLPPTVTTSAPSEVTQSTVLCGGTVTNDGNVQLTACGVCWSTQHFPTISDAHTENDLSVSAFTSHIEGLAHNTTYYVRAYATNAVGTTYGAEMVFTTQDIPSGNVNMPDPCSADTNTTWHPILNNGSTLCAGTDSVELTLNNYQYGSIQWQYSTDTISWFDIPDANDALLIYLPKQTQFIRAAVTYSNCPTEYSDVKLLQKTPSAYAGISRTINIGDTLRLQANMEEGATGGWQILQGANGFLTDPTYAASKFYGTDSLYRLRWTLTNSCGVSSDDINVRYVHTAVSSKVVVVDTTDIIFSDSAQMAQGFYMISFSDPDIVIGDSTILVSIVNGGFLRKVDSWSMSDDTTYAMYTSQATLYDMLESGVIQFDATSSGSEGAESDSTVQNAPQAMGEEFLDHIPTRKELREHPEMNGKMYVIGMEWEREDGVKENLMPIGGTKGGTQGEGTIEDKGNHWEYRMGGGQEVTASSGIRFGNVIAKLNYPIAEYDRGRRLLKFGFNNANFNLSGYYKIIPTETNGNIDGGGFPLGTLSKECVYVIDNCPIYYTLIISVSFDVNGNVTISSEKRHNFNVSATFNSCFSYDANSNRFIMDTVLLSQSDNFDTKFNPDNYEESVDLNLSLKVRHSVKYYLSNGPTSDVVHNTKIVYRQKNYQNGMGWNGNVFPTLGVNVNLNNENAMNVIDYNLPNYNSAWIKPLREKPLLYPQKVEILSGNKQTITSSGEIPVPIPVSVKVSGSDGKEVSDVHVYFRPQDGGSVSDVNNKVETDPNGIAATRWTPGELNVNDGKHVLKAFIYDGQGQEINNSPLTFTAFEPGSQALSNGCANSTLQLFLKRKQENQILILAPQNGDPTYTLAMDGNNIGTITTANNFITINMPAPGNHEFTVTDANGCVATKSYRVEGPVDCNFSNLLMYVQTNGNTVILNGTGGKTPYKYSIDGGNPTDTKEFPSLSMGTHIGYVIDDNGCAVSQEIEITQGSTSILSNFPCFGAETVTDYDGNVYHTVQIGQQCWMKENMRTTCYADGSFIQIGYGRFYPNDNPGNVELYGCLYNWDVATRGVSSGANPSGVQGICPYGWHVPSSAEWNQLTNYVSAQPQWRCEGSGIAKGLASPYGWNTSTGSCTPGNGIYMNNITGFSAPPAGRWYNNYYNFGQIAWFWSTNPSNASSNYAWTRRLYYNDTEVLSIGNDNGSYGDGTYRKTFGCSVRCLRN